MPIPATLPKYERLVSHVIPHGFDFNQIALAAYVPFHRLAVMAEERPTRIRVYDSPKDQAPIMPTAVAPEASPTSASPVRNEES